MLLPIPYGSDRKFVGSGEFGLRHAEPLAKDRDIGNRQQPVQLGCGQRLRIGVGPGGFQDLSIRLGANFFSSRFDLWEASRGQALFAAYFRRSRPRKLVPENLEPD